MIHLQDVGEWVRKGASLLDKHYRGWENQVLIYMLDPRHTDRCVLGQLYGSYYDGVAELCLKGDETFEHGFSFSNIKLPTPPEGVSERAARLHVISVYFKITETLNEALLLCWKNEIRKRLEKRSPVKVEV
jgi:hypothetical protein